MSRYEQLKAKWTELAQGEWPEVVLDPGLLSPRCSFVMVIEDWEDDPEAVVGGGSFFDSVLDALAYLRFIRIPMELDNLTVRKRVITKPAEHYLDKFPDDWRAKVKELLAELDGLLHSDGVTPGAPAGIIERYNECFDDASLKAGSRICVWGGLVEVLSSPYLWAREEVTEALQDGESDWLPALKELLDNGRFNAGYERHLRLAREFFEMVVLV